MLSSNSFTMIPAAVRSALRATTPAARPAVARIAARSARRALSVTSTRFDAAASPAPKPPQLKRFWRAVSLKEGENGYNVLLDGRAVKTPKGTPLTVPAAHRHMAYMVSGEWESQDKLIKPYSLPLTSLVVRAQDDMTDPEVRADATDKLMKFLDTDATCYHSDHPECLVELQQQHWDPLVDWVRTTFNVELFTTTSLLAPKQPAATKAVLRAHVDQYTPHQMACFEKAVLASKSFVIGLALVEGRLSGQQASDAARVEVMSQIARFGEVEDAHDVDREDIQRQMAAIAVGVAASQA
ncbi:ATP synthase complex assembly protein atp12 [Allomyces javanicus]|nr:ATP synthase complex assembly protein atp12 [Allomyces javanicus]